MAGHTLNGKNHFIKDFHCKVLYAAKRSLSSPDSFGGKALNGGMGCGMVSV